jgi:DNA-binding NarL/FixJ family response regulator
MVGRQAEMAILDLAMDRPPGEIQVLEITGDPWMGKTRLLDAFTSSARQRGWKVTAGSSGPLLHGLPFAMFSDAIDRMLADEATAWSDGLALAERDNEPGILTALAVTGRWQAAPGSIAVYKTLRSIGAMLQSVSSPTGLLLVFDDAHHADEASMELLNHLAHHPPSGNLLIALGYRPLQARPELLSLLGEVRASGRSQLVRLGPLPEADLAALLPADLNRSNRRALLREAGGNPGLLRALISVSAGTTDLSGDAWQLPEDVSAACLRDFRSLSSEAWLVARAAALMDEPFEPDLLMGVAQLSELQAFPAIDELTSRDVLRPDNSLRRFRFRNSLIRLAVYNSAGVGWRLGAHSRAAAKLASRRAPATLLARHLEHSVRFGERSTVRTLLAAAQASLWDRPTRAVAWIKAADDLSATASARSRLLLGKALTLAGPIEDGIETLDRIEPHDPQYEQIKAEIVLWRAFARQLAGQAQDAARDVAELAAIVGEASGELRYQLDLALLTGSVLASAEPGAVAQQRVASCPEPRYRAHGLVLLGAANIKCGRSERAAPLLREATRLLDELPDAEMAMHLDALRWLGWAENELGKHEDALAHLKRGVMLADRRALNSLLPAIAIDYASLLVRAGDPTHALGYIDRAAEAAELAGATFRLGAALDLRMRITLAGQRRAGENAGQAAADKDDGRHELGQGRGYPGADLSLLSERELEIASMVSDGRTNQQIARALGLSHKTIETYLGRIFKKLDFCSRAQIATMIGQSRGADGTAAQEPAKGQMSPSALAGLGLLGAQGGRRRARQCARLDVIEQFGQAALAGKHLRPGQFGRLVLVAGGPCRVKAVHRQVRPDRAEPPGELDEHHLDRHAHPGRKEVAVVDRE